MEITVDKIVALKPCYSRERVEDLMAHGGFTLDVLCEISADDARWVLSKLLTADNARIWARNCALLSLANWEKFAPVPEAVRSWLTTGDEKYRESAARSAESAARSAARSAESAARSAESAARSAAESAAESAESAESAAWSAARSAWSAARSARSAANRACFEIALALIEIQP